MTKQKYFEFAEAFLNDCIEVSKKKMLIIPAVMIVRFQILQVWKV